MHFVLLPFYYINYTVHQSIHQHQVFPCQILFTQESFLKASTVWQVFCVFLRIVQMSPLVSVFYVAKGFRIILRITF